MLFPTFDFLLFLIPTLVGFWMLADKPVARTAWLLFASYFFYVAGPKTEPPPAPAYFVGLLLFSTVLDFACGRAIHKLAPLLDAPDQHVARAARRKRGALLGVSLVGNLGLLGYFKYANFFIEVLSDAAAVAGVDVAPLHLDVILPLGISFYTFQSLSYTLDVYRGRLEPEPSFARFALFVVFFPQLVAGPIVRASELLPQLRKGPRFSRARIEEGAFRIWKGLAKKVVLGDWIAVHLTDRIFDAPATFTTAELLLALYAYTLQIYADFSGYTDIAIGTARLLGFELPENFNRPYQSRDIAEYWRRWHMTLSGWLRDYLFFPIVMRFGSRSGYLAVWLTMFLIGMWHGASWNFVIYANIHAAAMVFNRWNRTRDRGAPEGAGGAVAAPRRPGRGGRALLWPLAVALLGLIIAALGSVLLRLPWEQAALVGGIAAAMFALVCWLPETGGKLNTVVHVALTFHLLVCSRIFFRAQGLETARAFCRGLLELDLRGIRPGLVTPWIAVALVGGLALHFTPKRWVDERLLGWFRATPGWILGLGFSLFIFGLMLLMHGSPRAFIYFQF